MDGFGAWGDALTSAFSEFAATVAALMPRLLAALVLVLIGWLAARLLRAITLRLVRALDHLFQRVTGVASDEYRRIRRSTDSLVSNVVFWLVFLLFLGSAANVLGLAIFSRWVDAVLHYLPTLAAGIAIILAGFIAGDLMRGLVVRAARTASLAQSELLGRATQIAVVVAGVVIGTGQLGLDVSFLVNVATVAVGAILGGLALGLALSTPAHISNLIGARHLRGSYREGDVIAIGDYRGKILSISDRAVIIETEEGDVSIPAKLFAEQPCTRLAGEEGSDEDR